VTNQYETEYTLGANLPNRCRFPCWKVRQCILSLLFQLNSLLMEFVYS